jgi:2-keto-4-pentenoate hydratase/2-oxohepta-3-ene-1,7-dioic acid hydratase in catechol pathway
VPPRPFLWIKPPTTLLDPGGTVMLPNHPNGPVSVCHEAEVAVVIGRRCSRVSPEQALDYVFGYTCILDITASIDQPNFRELQDFVDGKIFDTFGPLGPHIETDLKATEVRVKCRVNGETRQDEVMTDQIWPIPQLLSIVSHSVTMEPGDVLATGTPPGMSALKSGDVVEADVEGIGVLRVNVSTY